LEASATFDDISTHERDILVRYCVRFTGDAFVAEGLAQQALLEAWRKSDTLYDRQVRERWLLGMARNVCLRWARAWRGRGPARAPGRASRRDGQTAGR
jgi:DNA-directed RNA polymerase specialized sigma24 family protein